MISLDCAPETYQQWLACFQYLEEHPWDQPALDMVCRGCYSGKPSEAFLARLSDTVSVMLTKCCRRFLRELDQALADGEPDMAMLLAVRFRRKTRACLFYHSLLFLDAQYKQILDDGFHKQLQSFWESFLSQLRRTARDSMDVTVEDMALELSRLRIVSEGRSGQGYE